MVIEYETSTFVKETHQIEIKDTKNIFLKGTNPYDGLNTYFGVWTNKNYLVIATLISNHNISYEYSLDKNIYTSIDIKKYLENNKNVKIISKDEFRKQLHQTISLFEI